MRKHYSKEIEAKLLVESKNRCNICWQQKDVQIHHINEDSSDSSEDNLIVICLDCHSKVHTKRSLAKNYSPETLRLYKTTWTDLVRKYPFEDVYVNEKNDIKIIQFILEQSDRGVLYFPLKLVVPYNMFKSIKKFRENIQKSGYRLLLNNSAKEAIRNVYKILTEIEFLFPTDPNCFDSCLFHMMSKNGIELLDLKRKEIIYHIQNLGKLIGKEVDIIDCDEFLKMGFDINLFNKKQLKCFGNYQKNCSDCKKCEFREECLLETKKN